MIYILNSAFHFSAQHSLEILARTMLCFQRCSKFSSSYAVAPYHRLANAFWVPVCNKMGVKIPIPVREMGRNWGSCRYILKYYLLLISLGHQGADDHVIKSLLQLESNSILECLGMCFGGKKFLFEGKLARYYFSAWQTGNFGCEEGHAELGREASVCLN